MKPAVRTETDLRYTNAYLAEEIVFAPTDDELVVTFDSTDDTTDTLDALSGAAPLALDADRGFAIARVSAALDDLSAKLADDDAIANSLPVLRDGDGANRYVMPDEFCVQFTADTSAEQARALLAELGADVVRAQRTDGYFTVAVPNDQGLFETMRTVGTSDLVEFVDPSEVGWRTSLSPLCVTSSPHAIRPHRRGVTSTAMRDQLTPRDPPPPPVGDFHRGRKRRTLKVNASGSAGGRR